MPQASPPPPPPTAPAASDPPSPPPFFARLVEEVSGDDSLHDGPKASLPQSLQELDYDAARSIRFRPERSLWRGEPGNFEVQFFHPGWFFDLVDVYVVEKDEPYPFPFSTQLFSYGSLERPSSGAGLGFTGLRIHAPINRPDYRDEVIVFQGGSYFRSLGAGQAYGLSARALAVDMGGETPEEFPAFRDFYLVRPTPDDQAMWILATMGSTRVKGVYAFRVAYGATTVVDVVARVWVKQPVDALGLAPASSMFFFGEEAPASFGDFRPEVHDSDGLLLYGKDGEWLFRPLRNPPRTTRSEFRLDSPRGFGLLQRDRDFSSYQDLEAYYERRPSVWIEPLSDWGKGALHLLEIATRLETDDNIAVAWVPDVVPEEGLSLRYRIHFGKDVAPAGGPSGSAIATRLAATERGRRFVVDFRGAGLRPDAPVTAQVDARGARVTEQHVMPNPPAQAMRLSFEVVPKPGVRDVELRAFLRNGGDILTETWSYLWQPTP